MEARPGPPVETAVIGEVISEDRAFAALEQEWAELYDNSPKATPFQSWAWLYSWWENYGGDYKLRLLTFREGSTLVGILPLMLDERRLGLGRLLFIGTGITDYLDIVVREGWKEEVCRSAVEALRGMGGWRVADLQELRPGARAWRLVEAWTGAKAHVDQSVCPLIPVRPWPEVLVSVSKGLRKTARRSIRWLEEDRVRVRPAAEEPEVAARRLVALHRESWEGRDITPEHQSRRFEGHLVAATRRMSERGLGRVVEFRHDGETVASHFLLLGSDFVGEYLGGATRDFLQRYQVSSLFVWDAINAACDGNTPAMSFLRGEEPYKMRWTAETAVNRRAILGRSPGIAWLPYAGYHAGRAAARRYLYSGKAPEWFVRAAGYLRGLRRSPGR